MTWLIACERSGVIRDAMLAKGIDAVSCDLEPSRALGPHIQGDALEQIQRRWTGVIAHPVCRRLTNAGAKHLYLGGRKENGVDEEMWQDMLDAAAFFNAFKKANAHFIAIENPIMHCHAAALCGRADQFVQPWWFGDKAFKATGFHLINLPKLTPLTNLPHQSMVQRSTQSGHLSIGCLLAQIGKREEAEHSPVSLLPSQTNGGN